MPLPLVSLTLQTQPLGRRKATSTQHLLLYSQPCSRKGSAQPLPTLLTATCPSRFVQQPLRKNIPSICPTPQNHKNKDRIRLESTTAAHLLYPQSAPSIPSIHPSLYPSNPWLSDLERRTLCVRDGVKHFAQVQADEVTCSAPIHQCCSPTHRWLPKWPGMATFPFGKPRCLLPITSLLSRRLS